ncbi:vWA domain-containing protein [Mycolicibacterium septicum]|uniref:vWA domain-containing protein n=1 Tax=Mycolicibacterium septicum TaxID=98668 RepID=UPI003CFACE3F
MTSSLLRGADLAAFAVALVDRLRAGGVTVSAVGPSTLVQAMHELVPAARSRLYWAARLSLVTRVEDLPAFDAVFDAVFADAVLGLDPPGLKRSALSSTAPAQSSEAAAGETADADLPWTTRPASVAAAAGSPDGRALPDLMPSWVAARADEPFERFDSDELRRIGAWLESAEARWPHRRTLRRRSHPVGRRVDLRETIRASRTTGWEPLRVARTLARLRPRRVVLVCDVSGSMQPYAAVYLHLMRAAAVHRRTRPEVFAFATTLTRLTAVLSHRSAVVWWAGPNDKVADRYGGTRLARSIGALLTGPHGHALRGAVVVIASDGWDSDPPELLRREMVRLRRRAHLVVWLNPRAAAPDYVPLAGSMAAALPLCDHFLPAHTLAGLRELFDVLGRS